MSIFDRAITFAAKAHSGMHRKSSTVPYIVHPLEVATIAATFTDDEEILAAAVLHDVVEDTSCTQQDIRELFGERVAALVAADSENKRENLPAEQTWKVRKEETLALVQNASRDEKIIVFSDKLSNLRAICRDYSRIGARLWERFNQKDPSEQLWYYGAFLDTCAELSEESAYEEYLRLFGELKHRVVTGNQPDGLRVLAAPTDNRWILQNDRTGQIYSFTEEEFAEFIKD